MPSLVECFFRGEQVGCSTKKKSKTYEFKDKTSYHKATVASHCPIHKNWVADFREGTNEIKNTDGSEAAIPGNDGYIYFPKGKPNKKPAASFSVISQANHPIPNGAKYLVVEEIKGKFPDIAAEAIPEEKLKSTQCFFRSWLLQKHSVDEFASGKIRMFKIPDDIKNTNAPVLTLIFALTPGNRLPENGLLRVYFAK